MSVSATARITEPRAKGIVASVRCDERSSAPLQSRSASARDYLDAVLLVVSKTRMDHGSRGRVRTGQVLARVTVVDHAIAILGGPNILQASNCRLFRTLDHRLGPGDVSFEAKRFRHRAIAAHQVPVGDIVAAGPG